MGQVLSAHKHCDQEAGRARSWEPRDNEIRDARTAALRDSDEAQPSDSESRHIETAVMVF